MQSCEIPSPSFDVSQSGESESRAAPFLLAFVDGCESDSQVSPPLSKPICLTISILVDERIRSWLNATLMVSIKSTTKKDNEVKVGRTRKVHTKTDPYTFSFGLFEVNDAADTPGAGRRSKQ